MYYLKITIKGQNYLQKFYTKKGRDDAARIVNNISTKDMAEIIPAKYAKIIINAFRRWTGKLPGDNDYPIKYLSFWM